MRNINLSRLFFLVVIITFYSCNYKDENIRKNIVNGCWSYSYTDESEEDNISTLVSVSGISTFNENGTCEEIETITITYIDEDGYTTNMKYKCEVTGKYEIKESNIIYHYNLENIQIQLLQTDNYELSKLFEDHYLPQLKNEMISVEKEKILELTKNQMKIESEYEGEKDTLTYIRQVKSIDRENDITEKSNKEAVSENKQTKIDYEIPNGYEIFKNSAEELEKIDEEDFDNDGIKDLAIVCTKNNVEEYNYLLLFFSTAYLQNNTFYKIPIDFNHFHGLDYKNSILQFGVCLGTGRYCKNYKFKYYSNLSNMRLIGYEEEYFGNAVHDGAYTKSVNLLTNTFEIVEHQYNTKTDQDVIINNISAKATTPVITLASFDAKTLTYLEELGRNYFKNQ